MAGERLMMFYDREVDDVITFKGKTFYWRIFIEGVLLLYIEWLLRSLRV
jgi:hypothetical protein